MSRKMIRRIISMIVALPLAILVIWVNPLWSEEDPTISLIKTIEVKEFEGLKVSADEYVVKEGDSISKLLIQRRVTPLGRDLDKLIRMVKALNPGLTDVDKIRPGQKLVLPTGPIEGLETAKETAAKKSEDAGAKPSDKEPGTPGLKESEPTTSEASPEEKQQTRKIKVQTGDTLWVLLKRAGVPENLILNNYIKITMKLNPEITDPNLIMAGQELVLPMLGAWPEATMTGRPGLGIGLPVPPTATRVKPSRVEKAEQEVAKVILPPAQIPPGEELGVRQALSLVFTRIGERVISSGEQFLPLKTGGHITINNQSFPIIEVRSGLRIVLDLEQRLPQEIAETIRSNWTNYVIFRPKPKEGPAAMIGRLLETCRYYKVIPKGEPLVISGEVKIKARADWIVWPSEEDFAGGQAIIINFPSEPSQGTSAELADFLSSRGIKIIDFYPKGNQIGPERGSEPAAGPERKIEEITPGTNQEFVQALLGFLGQKYETDISIPVMKSGPGREDFNLTVQAPVYFSRGGSNFVVAADGLAENLRELMEKQKFKVITREEGEDAATLAFKLLRAMNIKAESGLTLRASRRQTDRNIEVTIPGVVFSDGRQDYFLTPVALPSTLAPLITRPDLRVVRYRLAGPPKDKPSS